MAILVKDYTQVNALPLAKVSILFIGFNVGVYLLSNHFFGKKVAVVLSSISVLTSGFITFFWVRGRKSKVFGDKIISASNVNADGTVRLELLVDTDVWTEGGKKISLKKGNSINGKLIQTTASKGLDPSGKYTQQMVEKYFIPSYPLPNDGVISFYIDTNKVQKAMLI